MDSRQFGLDVLNGAEKTPEQDLAHALWVELDMIAALATKERDRLPFMLAGEVSLAETQRQVKAARRVTSWVSRVTDRVRPKRTHGA